MEKLYKIEWLGLNHVKNVNGIFGHLIMSDTRQYAFWGHVGGTIGIKRHSDWQTAFYLTNLVSIKQRKGFKKIEPEHYELLCSTFFDDLERSLTGYILSED
jgi:hypothetical protein